MTQFVKGYSKDAAVDVILEHPMVLQPGLNEFVLPVQYTPAEGEVAFLIARGSTAKKGILPFPVAIDAGYSGKITAWVFNASGVIHTFMAGDRAFSIVNLKLGEDRVDFQVAKDGERGSNKLASSGGQNGHSRVKKD